MLYLSALPRPHMLCVKPQVLRPPLPTPPPASYSLGPAHLCRPPHLVYSPRALGAHGRHLGQSHGGPGEVDPTGKESSVRWGHPEPVSQAPPLGVMWPRPQLAHVMSCTLS